MKVAAIQHDICWEDPQATFEHLTPMIAGAVASGARLVVLTEMFSTGFSMDAERIAEPEDGLSTSFLVEQAGRHGVWVCGSIPTRTADGGRPANVLTLAAPDGALHRYAKIHPFSYAGEHERYRAGADFVTVDIEGIRTSLFVCYDLRFADEFWALARTTDCYVVVANWPEVRRAHWQSLLVARAIENQAYVVGCNRVGTDGNGLAYCGDSRIIDPLGEIIAAGARVETTLLADVSAENVAAVRDRFRFLQDRRG